MIDKNKLPPDALSYFEGLPKIVQESIMQAGVSFYTRDELAAFCKQLEQSR